MADDDFSLPKRTFVGAWLGEWQTSGVQRYKNRLEG